MERSDRTKNSELHIQTSELSETAPRRRNRTPLRFLIVLPLILATPALAQVRVPVSAPVIASSPASDPRAALFETGQRRYLLGDWGGKRAWLAEKGVTFDFFYISDMQANPAAECNKLKLGGKEFAEPSTLISIASSRGRRSVFTPPDSVRKVHRHA